MESGSDSPLKWALIDEIRAEMARRHINQLRLAQRLQVSQPWLNRRLMGHTDLTVTEGEAIARALGTTFAELVRRADGLVRLRYGADGSDTHVYDDDDPISPGAVALMWNPTLLLQEGEAA
jgi:transcriptional regulator with XRE-family HTH domain